MIKKLIASCLSGILLSLAWPTYGFPLLLFIAFIPLLWLEYDIRQAEEKKAGIQVFLYSYLTFFIWNFVTTSWLYYSTPFGMWFAVGVNSLLMSLIFLIYHFLAKRVPFHISAIFLTSLWISFENLHLQWEFSWPWLNLGNAFSEYYQWIQWYEFTGTFGGTLWVWMLNFIIFKSVLLYLQHKDTAILRGVAIQSLLLIGIPIGISYYMFHQLSYEEEPQLETLILQPNINPYTEKYNTNDKHIGEVLNQLTQEKISPTTELVLAPETVFADGTELAQWDFSFGKNLSLKTISGHPKANFLGGISFYEKITSEENVEDQTNFVREGLWYNDFNSAFMLNSNEEDQIYHKSKLVVGVENFPYQSVLKPILGDAMIDLGGTVAMKTTQEDREVFNTLQDHKIAPIICYESVYGEYVSGYVRNDAQVLAIITNDAWWGNTQGHQQHLSYARLRAIENRRSVVRSANTGISAAINPKGEIIKSLGYEKKGSLLVSVPIVKKITFYVRYGDYIARISLFMLIFVMLFAFTRRRSEV